MKTLEEHLEARGPKRILSLDGGGIRGALALGLLQKLEDVLRRKNGNDKDFRLCHYFDLIGGTSTGAIIAAALAKGDSVADIKNMYMALGGEIFGDKREWWNPLETIAYLKAKFNEDPLEKALKHYFKEETFGDKSLKTGLCIVCKRADTNSTWPFFNHPRGKYFKHNCDIPIWKLLRASTAAPTYFVPMSFDVVGNKAENRDEIGAFIDGGVSMSNNPAFTLLLGATLKGFPFKWPLGEDNLTLVSVGTGSLEFQMPKKKINEAWLKTWAENLPDMFMQDASYLTQTIMQWLSNSPTAQEIDSEMGDLSGDLPAEKPLLKYLRYNVRFSEKELNALDLGKTFSREDVERLSEMSRAENREMLHKIGVAASKQIQDSHFD